MLKHIHAYRYINIHTCRCAYITHTKLSIYSYCNRKTVVSRQIHLPNRSNWNRSPSFASFKMGTAKASEMTIFEFGFKSASQSSNSLGFCNSDFRLVCIKRRENNKLIKDQGLPQTRRVCQTIALPPSLG